MKSYGVRIAAGALTVFAGAAAAALAHKDKQSDADSWTAAQPPSLGEPVAPISGVDGDAWLSQPVAAATESSVPDTSEAPPTFADSDSSGIKLVQHSEPIESTPSAPPTSDSPPSFDPSLIPESLDPGSEPDDGPSDSWLLPPPESSQSDPSAGPSSSPDTGPALSMTLPSEDSAESSATLQPDSASDPPNFEFSEVPMADATNTPSSLTDGAASPSFASTPLVGTDSAGGEPALAADTPQNALRGSDTGANMLRDAAAAGTAAIGVGAAAAAVASDSESALSLDTGSLSMNSTDPSAGPTSAAQQLTIPGQDIQIASEPATINGLAPAPNPAGGASQPAGISSQIAPNQEMGQNVTGQSMAGQSMTGQSMTGQSEPRIVPRQPSALSMESSAVPDSAAPLQPRSMDIGGASQPFATNAASSQSMPRSQPVPLNQPADAIELRQDTTIDAPGDRRLEGMQTPSIVIQKRAPNEVKVGKQATFVIHVQNVGAVEALDVTVHDRIPAGMRLVDATPAPVQNGNLMVWQLGSMPAGHEQTVTLQLIPEQEGELGSVARVSFEAAASVRTIATRPELKIVQRAPETVLIGQQLEIELEVSNPGTGEATGVVLQEDVPEGLDHPKGRQLDNALGNLRPGEVRQQVLRLRAVEPGIVNNTIRLTGDDGLVAEHTVTVQVVSPDLQIALEGPSRRFLERQAKYELNVANAGTADATNIELAVQLDRGFTFVSTDYEGQYDPSRHTVYWSLAQLPAGASGKVPLVLLPVEEGEQAIRINARADLGVVAESERRMTVEGFAELSFSIANPGGPIEMGAETTYEIRVNNRGSKADTNVQVALELPPGLELLSANGSGEAGTDGQGLVRFQPASQLNPNAELAYTVRVRGVSAGTHVVRAVVVSDQATVPVTKEESTLVYADQ